MPNNQKSTIASLLAGNKPEDLIAAIRKQAEEDNRTAQSALAPPPAQPDKDWRDRAAWLLDGQAIHGELKVFYAPAYLALKKGDQSEYSRQRDLLMKALITIFGPVAEPEKTNGVE